MTLGLATRPWQGTLAAAGHTHRGLVRRDNEDAFLVRDDLQLWAVADGVGGLWGGSQASQAIVEALGELRPGPDLAARALDCLQRINAELFAQGKRSGAGPMGSTVVVCVREAERFICFWAGDSRLYRLRQGKLHQVTSDHTPVQDAIDAGFALPGDANAERFGHLVNRAMGVQETVEVARIETIIEAGDIFLLCTDGLSKAVAAETIAQRLATPDPANAAQALVTAALEGGGPDNVTVIAVRTLGDQRAPAAAELAWDEDEPALTAPIMPAAAPVPAPATPASPAARAPAVRRGNGLLLLAIILALFASSIRSTVWHAGDPGPLTLFAPQPLATTDPAMVLYARQLLGLWAELGFELAAVLALIGRRLRFFSFLAFLAILFAIGLLVLSATSLAQPGDLVILARKLPFPSMPLSLGWLSSLMGRTGTP